MGGGLFLKSKDELRGQFENHLSFVKMAAPPSTNDKQLAPYHGGLCRRVCMSLHCSLNFTTGHFMHWRGGHVAVGILLLHLQLSSSLLQFQPLSISRARFHLSCVAISRPSCLAFMLVTLKSNILLLSFVILEVWGKYWRHEVGQNKSWARREKKNSCRRDSTAPTGNLQLTFT